MLGQLRRVKAGMEMVGVAEFTSITGYRLLAYAQLIIIKELDPTPVMSLKHVLALTKHGFLWFSLDQIINQTESVVTSTRSYQECKSLRFMVP